MAPKTAEREGTIKPFAEMSEAEFREFDQKFISSLEMGDDSAARASLAVGVPIYYAEEDTPAHCVIKEYPDGRMEIVSLIDGVETVLRTV